MRSVKTYKREGSSLILAITYLFALWGVLGNEQAMHVFELTLVPSHMLWAAAFGLDSLNTQWRK